MEHDFWLNLASKDLARSREFFVKMGFAMNDAHPNPHMVSMFIGRKKIVLNLFPATTLEGFAQQPVTDPSLSNEVLFSLGAESRAEVDEIAKKAADAGGIVYGRPGEKDGWMYGCGFIDPDGHRWSVLYMDMSKMPRREPARIKG